MLKLELNLAEASLIELASVMAWGWGVLLKGANSRSSRVCKSLRARGVVCVNTVVDLRRGRVTRQGVTCGVTGRLAGQGVTCGAMR